jgi:N-carbamoylputrescine amidase
MKILFTPGDLGFKTIPTKKGKITLICWDQWYPEAARLTALQGAEVLFYPTAIGWHPQEKKSNMAKTSMALG